MNNKEETVLLFDLNCIKAAKILADCDVLVVVTGAGWGADSGLATYDDIAQVPAYQQLNLTYSDICQPHWIETNPELFYGFWGQCYNDYRTTKPHEGLDIIARWRDDKNNKYTPTNEKNNVANEIRCAILDQIEMDHPFDSLEVQKLTPYPVQGIAGAFYCFTSNVDGHLYDKLNANEIHDCHGCIELWQCSDPDCDSGIWRVPISWDFHVNKETMLAPSEKKQKYIFEEQGDDSSDEEEDDEDGSGRKNQKHNNNNEITKTSCIGHTTGKERRNKQQMLQNMPDGTDKVGWYVEENNNNNNNNNNEVEETLFSNNINNWPKCGHCNGEKLARPAILMFGDYDWKHDESQYIRWDLWLETMIELSSSSAHNNANNCYKVCVIEIGCGTNVQTCRRTSEQIVSDVQTQGGDATLIRINPDYPLTDDVMVKDVLIPIQSRGLKAIQRIDEIYKEIINTDTNNSR